MDMVDGGSGDCAERQGPAPSQSASASPDPTAAAVSNEVVSVDRPFLPCAEKANWPECLVRAEYCLYRKPDGHCQVMQQQCRILAENHRPPWLDDFRTIMAEFRDGLVGLALVPPIKKIEFPKTEGLQFLPEGFFPDGHQAQKQVAKQPASEWIRCGTIGRLRWDNYFVDVWVSGEHSNLKRRNKARFCLLYLVAKHAFDPESARDLDTEIDPFVRKKCKLPPSSEIRIQHYFHDHCRKLSRLRSDLIKAAGRNGRFYLQVF